MKTFRIIDANLNRASEGLRVIEEIGRFVYENAEAVKNIKELRHKVRKTAKEFDNLLFSQRNSLTDWRQGREQKKRTLFLKRR